ncbi:hypothetical protein G6F24_016354 [Rhizopus arrhizus]|nr:hypothetical protein G6F24_016354 [Rhizopus arrhizus]
MALAAIEPDWPVRPGAGAEEAGALWPHRTGRSARHLRAAGAGDRRNQHPCQLRGRQPEGAGGRARGRGQAAPRRHRCRRGLAGALVPGPGAAADPFGGGSGYLVEGAGAGAAQDAALVAGRPAARRRQ